MMTEAALRVLKLYTDQPFTHTGSHLRGSLLSQFPDRERMHNHPSQGETYRSSEIRYVVRDQVPAVVGAGEGRHDLLDLYFEVREIVTPNQVYRVTGKDMLEGPLDIEVTPGLHRYRFATPWLALNQQNHQRFDAARDDDERRRLLETIAVGNFLTAATAVGVILPLSPRVKVEIHHWSSRPIHVRDQSMLSFRGNFSTNLVWNPWVGIGKMVSKGFGLIE
jgi:hypothetical protein